VHRELAELHEREHAEAEAERTHDEPEDQQGAAGRPADGGDRAQVGQDEAGLAAVDALLAVGRGRRRAPGERQDGGGQGDGAGEGAAARGAPGGVGGWCADIPG